jgi:hypothetical protein
MLGDIYIRFLRCKDTELWVKMEIFGPFLLFFLEKFGGTKKSPYFCRRMSVIRHAPSNPPGLDRSKGVRL